MAVINDQIVLHNWVHGPSAIYTVLIVPVTRSLVRVTQLNLKTIFPGLDFILGEMENFIIVLLRSAGNVIIENLCHC